MEMTEVSIAGYRYDSASLGHAHDYLLPSVFRLLDGLVAATSGVGGGEGDDCGGAEAVRKR